MSFYENPVIGWFVRKKIAKILILLVICIIFSFLIFYNYTHLESNGCVRPDCYTTPCSGWNCISTGCRGTNCKGGDCYGEDCKAGDCEGIGCRAGDCYGLYCQPGECIDPTCRGDRKRDGLCTPFCENGKAYTLPVTEAYHIVKYLPKDSILNPNFCSNKQKTYMFDSDRMYNFNVEYINLYTSGIKKYEDWLVKEKTYKGKSFVLSNDTQFIGSIPEVFKGENCEWCSTFKNNVIKANFKPYINNKTNELSWIKKNTLVSPIDDTGKEQNCNKRKEYNEPPHNMKVIANYSVTFQINSILSKKTDIHNKNFEIDSIMGEKLVSRCLDCDKRSVQYLDVSSHPTDLNGTIKPCKVRIYEVSQQVDEYDQPISHSPINFKIYDKNSESLKNYYNNSSNVLKTTREHHLWMYNKTIDNVQYYKCYWCNILVKVDNICLPKDSSNNLLPCRSANDFNHYMYYSLDNNNSVFQKCIKCMKKCYP